MRFPSLFRLPRSQQFEIKPRYYDPVKEFVEQRKALANNPSDKDPDFSPDRIRFERRKSSQGLSTSLFQLIIALVLAAGVVGWLFLGNEVLYYSMLLIPVYLYFRFRKK
ncbi:MAG: hypothetical protein RIF46_08045 [Cyclobacteriaceae bacterium]